jgi:hypothetical protein
MEFRIAVTNHKDVVWGFGIWAAKATGSGQKRLLLKHPFSGGELTTMSVELNQSSVGTGCFSVNPRRRGVEIVEPCGHAVFGKKC